jgi:hypothetical protein
VLMCRSFVKLKERGQGELERFFQPQRVPVPVPVCTFLNLGTGLEAPPTGPSRHRAGGAPHGAEHVLERGKE